MKVGKSKKKTINDKDNYIPSNLNPIFGKMFEIPAHLPIVREGEGREREGEGGEGGEGGSEGAREGMAKRGKERGRGRVQGGGRERERKGKGGNDRERKREGGRENELSPDFNAKTVSCAIKICAATTYDWSTLN